MKNHLKTSKLLRWTAACAFSLMLVLNIMVSLEFEEGKVLPSITLIELGNVAMATRLESVMIGEKCKQGSRCTHSNYRYCGYSSTGDSCVCYNCN